MIFKKVKRLIIIYKDKFLSLSFIHKHFNNGTPATKEFFVVKSELINSNSQYSEDLVIDGIVGGKDKGFYVDIGANDPEVFNNTKRFYDRGWSGINIEPNPLLFMKLAEARKRDININCGIGPINQQLPFYCVSADTLSSFDKNDAERNCEIFGEKIVEIQQIQMFTLDEIFNQYLKDQQIDFMSVDVEGLEIKLLQSNDWSIYRPRLILIEIAHNFDKIYSYLKENNYDLVFKNEINGIFLDLKCKNN